MNRLRIDLANISPVKRGLLIAMLAAAALFVLLLFVQGARQREIFPYDELCDYRKFIFPCMTSERPYSAPGIALRDACYPPVAYCAVRALTTDRGEGWQLSSGEVRLLLSLFVMQCVGVTLLVLKIPWLSDRLVAAVVLLMSPACVCTLLRGNTSGWSFALVCIFLRWYRSDNLAWRMVAAVALGAATSLKLTPCLFGLLYVAESISRTSRIPWREIAVSALSAVVLVFIPFLFFGGACSIPQWISNGGANAAYYSVHAPIWGLVSFINRLIYSNGTFLSCIGCFARITCMLAVVLAVLGVFVRGDYRRLLCIGAAMALLTHHDYGGAYLIPAFVAWLSDADDLRSGRSGVCLLLEMVSWFVIFTPLQMPNPFLSGTLNASLQNEFLFVLVMTSFMPGVWNLICLCRCR